MACPSQWDAWDADGKYYYLRYRHGHGSVTHYSGPGWADGIGLEEGQLIASFRYGHPLDGDISLADFAQHAGIALASGLVQTGFGTYLRDGLIARGVDQEEADQVTKPWRDLEETGR